MDAPVTPHTHHIEGVIGDDGVTAAAVRAALEAAAGGPVSIHINSPGGSVTEALGIYDALAGYAGTVTVTVVGIAASAASMVAMAGERIVMRQAALMMIHDPSGVTLGTAADHDQSAATLRTMAESIAGIYAERSGLSVETVRELMLAETWLTADQAVELGFADAIEPARAVEPVAFDYRIFNRAPAWLRQTGADPMTTETTTTAAETATTTSPPSGGHREVVARCRAARLTDAEMRTIVAGARGDPDRARTMIIDMVADRDPDPTGGAVPRAIEESFDHPRFLASAIGDAIYARMTGRTPEGAAAEWAGASLTDMASAMMQARGERITTRSRSRLADQIIRMAATTHTTSDFPAIAASAGQRVLMESYQAAMTPLKAIARTRTATDFRAITAVRLGEAPSLLEVPESGEITAGSRAEAKEAYRIRTFARIFGLSREALVNDDLGAFSDTAAAWGRAAAEAEAAEIVALFTANSGDGVTLDDGDPLFTTGRGNKATTGGGIDVTALSLARRALRETKGLDGVTPIAATPRYLLVGAERETEADGIIATLQPATVDEVNPFVGNLRVLVEPRLTGLSWRVFADPTQAHVLEIAYLNGVQGPQLAQREGWTTLGIEFRAVLDFGCGLIGWRGSYLNAGE